MNSFEEQTNLINELKKQLEEAHKYIETIKERSKKSYNKKFFTNKIDLTEEEKQLKQERIQKRRDYMNKRYKEIYKKKESKL